MIRETTRACISADGYEAAGVTGEFRSSKVTRSVNWSAGAKYLLRVSRFQTIRSWDCLGSRRGNTLKPAPE